jgi:hypothetical protein
MKIRKPICLKCSKEMRHVSTGEKIKTFCCGTCKETKVIGREDKKNGAK